MLKSKPEFMFELKLNALKFLNVKLTPRKNVKFVQGSVRYRRVDRTVWNHNTLPLPITLDALEGKNFIRHFNGTNTKILGNSNYNRTLHS